MVTVSVRVTTILDISIFLHLLKIWRVNSRIANETRTADRKRICRISQSDVNELGVEFTETSSSCVLDYF